MIGVRLPAGAGNFSLHRVRNGSGAHPASYPMGTRGSFPGVKAAGRETDHSSPTSAYVKECVNLYFHSPNTPSWRDAQFKKCRNNFVSNFNFTWLAWLLAVRSLLLITSFGLTDPHWLVHSDWMVLVDSLLVGGICYSR
jgi:hypothetical protein